MTFLLCWWLAEICAAAEFSLFLFAEVYCDTPHHVSCFPSPALQWRIKPTSQNVDPPSQQYHRSISSLGFKGIQDKYGKSQWEISGRCRSLVEYVQLSCTNMQVNM